MMYVNTKRNDNTRVVTFCPTGTRSHEGYDLSINERLH